MVVGFARAGDGHNQGQAGRQGVLGKNQEKGDLLNFVEPFTKPLLVFEASSSQHPAPQPL